MMCWCDGGGCDDAVVQIVAGQKQAADFRIATLDPFQERLYRSMSHRLALRLRSALWFYSVHMNCVENLAIYSAIIGVACFTKRTDGLWLSFSFQ